MIASLEKTEVGRVTLGLTFSAAMASSVVVVSLAMREEPAGMN